MWIQTETAGAEISIGILWTTLEIEFVEKKTYTRTAEVATSCRPKVLWTIMKAENEFIYNTNLFIMMM